MLPTIVDGLTLPPDEIERRVKAATKQRPASVRASLPV